MHAYSLLALQVLVSSVAAQQRVVPRAAEATPFIPGQPLKRIAAPQPTSPPQAVRKLVGRDAATCGWMMSDGSPNVCGDQQYCTTSASNNGQFGVWNCCNPDSCYLATGCTKDKECAGDANYCVTSYMSNDGTTFSRFMCGTTSSIVSMAYSRKDTPQFTASQLSVSLSSALLASAASASAASASAAAAAALSQSSSTGTTTGKPTSANASPSEATSGSATTTETKSSGLSTGALAGIIIAVVIIIALVGAIAFFMWRRKNDAGKGHSGAPAAAEMSGAPLMSGAPVEHYKAHAYPDTYAHNAVPQQYPVELDGPPVVHEMGTK